MLNIIVFLFYIDESSSLTELTDDYDTDDIRQSLRKYGYPPGPLVSSTKRIYARKLSRIMKNKPELKQDDLATNILLGILKKNFTYNFNQ